MQYVHVPLLVLLSAALTIAPSARAEDPVVDALVEEMRAQVSADARPFRLTAFGEASADGGIDPDVVRAVRNRLRREDATLTIDQLRTARGRYLENHFGEWLRRLPPNRVYEALHDAYIGARHTDAIATALSRSSIERLAFRALGRAEDGERLRALVNAIHLNYTVPTSDQGWRDLLDAVLSPYEGREVIANAMHRRRLVRFFSNFELPERSGERGRETTAANQAAVREWARQVEEGTRQRWREVEAQIEPTAVPASRIFRTAQRHWRTPPLDLALLARAVEGEQATADRLRGLLAVDYLVGSRSSRQRAWDGDPSLAINGSSGPTDPYSPTDMRPFSGIFAHLTTMSADDRAALAQAVIDHALEIGRAGRETETVRALRLLAQIALAGDSIPERLRITAQEHVVQGLFYNNHVTWVMSVATRERLLCGEACVIREAHDSFMSRMARMSATQPALCSQYLVGLTGSTTGRVPPEILRGLAVAF